MKRRHRMPPIDLSPAPRPGAWFGPIMAMAQSSPDVKKNSKNRRKAGGAKLSIEVRDLGNLSDWLIEEQRLKAWDYKNQDAIEEAVATLLKELATRRPNQDGNCDTSCDHDVSPTDPND